MKNNELSLTSERNVRDILRNREWIQKRIHGGGGWVTLEQYFNNLSAFILPIKHGIYFSPNLSLWRSSYTTVNLRRTRFSCHRILRTLCQRTLHPHLHADTSQQSLLAVSAGSYRFPNTKAPIFFRRRKQNLPDGLHCDNFKFLKRRNCINYVTRLNDVW